MQIRYLCNWTGESGGIKVLYDHVRLLRRAGFDAALASYGEFARCTWFPSDPLATPAVSHLLDGILPEDLVVLPEFCMWDRQLASAHCRQLVFAQNPDLMTGSPHESRFEGLLVPSPPLVSWIREEQAYSGPIHVVEGFLEDELARAAHAARPEAPRFLIVDRKDKHRGEPARARDALQAVGAEVTYVDRAMPRHEFVALFRDHDVYLHLNHREGFPISILEAFGAGCLVAGFAGRGGLEFMVDGTNCRLVPDGDWRGAVRLALELASETPAVRAALVRAGRRTAGRYTEQLTLERLGPVFGELAPASARPSGPRKVAG